MEKNLNTNTRYGQLNRVINLLLLRLFSGLLLPYYKYATAIRVPFKQEQLVICPEITVHVNDPYLTFTLQKFITIKEGIITLFIISFRALDFSFLSLFENPVSIWTRDLRCKYTKRE